MILLTIAFVSCIPKRPALFAQVSFVSVVCRSSDLSIHVQTILLHKRIASAFSRSHDSSSNDRFLPHAGCVPHGKQYFRNTATLGNPLCFVWAAEPASFRVRDSHPIPLFSEQECVSERFSAAWRSEPCLPRLSGSRICHKSHAIQFFNTCAWSSARKKTSPARLSAKQKKSWFSSVFYFRCGFCTRKKHLFI